MHEDRYWLAIETGGTKLIARLDRGDKVVAEQRWPTTTPDAAALAIRDFVGGALPRGARLAGAAIAAFGPVVVDSDAANHGEVLATPKPGWTGSNLRRTLEQEFNIPVAIDTDVNAAALAEQAMGAGRGCGSVAYLTVGTGIGAGLAVHGRTLKGTLHPEMGHVPVVRHPDDRIPSICPFHANCVEGLAAGPAVQRRVPNGALQSSPKMFALVADYLGQLMATIVLAWSPHRIVAGGGVMQVNGLREAAAERMRVALAGYGVGPAIEASDFVVAAELDHAGLDGAAWLARQTA